MRGKEMKAIIINRDIPVSIWMRCFTREELREIANEKGVKVGRDKIDTATELSLGEKMFTVSININFDPKKGCIGHDAESVKGGS
jgi:hypothetical protein